MGHLTRRLTYDVQARRLLLPASFLETAKLSPGDPVWVLAPASLCRLVLPAPLVQSLQRLTEFLPPGAELTRLLSGRVRLELATQGRLTLPLELALPLPGPRAPLRWEMPAGLLELTALGSGQELEPPLPLPLPRSPGRPLEESPSPRLVSAAHPARPDGLNLPGPVEDVRLEHIHGLDLEQEPGQYDPALAESVATEGMLRPLVLMGPRPHRVLDGRRRLAVAQVLQLNPVPAIVLSSLVREDQARIRYLLETTTDRWALAQQLRLLARLQANGATLDELSRLMRRKPRTLQRYLRVARHPGLVRAIERGDLSLLEAEKVAVTPEECEGGRESR